MKSQHFSLGLMGVILFAVCAVAAWQEVRIRGLQLEIKEMKPSADTAIRPSLPAENAASYEPVKRSNGSGVVIAAPAKKTE